MASYNKVIMAGNLTRDPELSYLPSQMAVVDFGLAVNHRWRDKQTGQQRENVCFIDCRCFGKQAETLKQYMAKGRSILIEGRLDLDTWEGKDGQKRSKHRIFVERFTFLGSGQGGGQGGQQGGQQRGGYQQAPRQSAPPPQQSGPPTPQAPMDTGGYDDEPVPPQYDEPSDGEEIPF